MHRFNDSIPLNPLLFFIEFYFRMFATTGFPAGIGLVHGGTRLAVTRRRTANAGPSLNEIHRTCLHYHTAFSQLSENELREMFTSKL